TLVNVRDDGSTVYCAEDNISETVETIVEEVRAEEDQSEAKAPETEPAKTEVSSEYYARYRNIIAELKSLVNN
ncbi:hypothetical protein ACQUWZ_26750, partial [Ralstonia pseudosolanacearum]|uniref:hypothetical protein n=1 Tax=Ralstonia pseudosolanacearum TaxID=1310165 RepID=UPI003D166E4A